MMNPLIVRPILVALLTGNALQLPQGDPKAPGHRGSVEETLKWLQSLPETTGMVVKGLDPNRFKKMTAVDLRAMKTLVIGGHLKSDPKNHLQVEAKDFAHLLVLPDLEELSLTECRGTTDKAMIFIGQLEPLKKLKLGDGELTDDGLRSLEHLSKLTELNLGWCTQITDAGIPSMVKLSTLSRLTLSGTKVSPQGILNLREKLPGCVIVKD